MNCSEAIEKWYLEIKEYDFEKGLFSPKTGHFTQMVWIGSTEIGCARSVVRNKKKYEVYIECTYGLSGNYRGEFTQNVKKADDQDDAQRLFDEVEATYVKLNKTRKLPTKKFDHVLKDAVKGEDVFLRAAVDDEFEISTSPIRDLKRFEHCFYPDLLVQKIFKFDCSGNRSEIFKARLKLIRQTARSNLKNMLDIKDQPLTTSADEFTEDSSVDSSDASDDSPGNSSDESSADNSSGQTSSDNSPDDNTNESPEDSSANDS